MEKMKELYQKVANDSELQAKFAEIMKDAEKAGVEAAKEKLTAFAKEAGFEVSIDDMKEFFAALSLKKEGTLSDVELDMVAGGKGGNPPMISGRTDEYLIPCKITSILIVSRPYGC